MRARELAVRDFRVRDRRVRNLGLRDFRVRALAPGTLRELC